LEKGIGDGFLVMQGKFKETFCLFLCYIRMQLKKIVLLLAFMPLFSLAQQADAVLSKFFAVQVEETVFMRWTMIAGNTCEDTYVERSSDGISYERVGLIGGICGSPDEAITFEFTDSLPLVNRTSYYRLLLGYFGYTSPKVVEFRRYNDDGFLLAPNPFSDFTRLVFENKDGLEYKLLLYSVNGMLVKELTTSGDEFILSGTDLASGLYAYRLLKEEKNIFSGKLIKK
jgi:hypothetical protein